MIEKGKDAHTLLKEIRKTLQVPESYSIADWAKKTMTDMTRAKEIMSKFGFWQLWNPKTQ